MKKCLIAMSGGVDSSVAAYLMKERGYDCVGCTMKLFEGEAETQPEGRACCSLNDVEDARSVARKLGFPYYVFNFKAEFGEKVIQNFIRCYETGCTPNPCIDCNRYLKFEKLYQRARELGCDWVVTGHYARAGFDETSGRYYLKKAADESKDQSYVLFRMTQEQLAHTQFPLGEMTKAQTRELAERSGFVNAAKPDSQDICFVPDGDYAGFLQRHMSAPSRPGPFVDRVGNVLGEHKGIIHYTVGQRRGLGIAAEHPLYVVKICPEDNTVVLGKNEDLFTRELTARDLNLIAMDRIEGELRCKAKIRYRHAEQPCSVWQTDDDALRVVFDEPQRAITPGQSVVLYDGDAVLAGGVIV